MNLEKIKFYIALYIGKIIYRMMKLLGLDATTFPGRIALKIDSNFLRKISEKISIRIVVTGTNGKTTTNNLIHHILKRKGYKVLGNLEGANLRSGIATSYIRNSGIFDFGTFEVDEGIFPYVYEEIRPNYVVITNFFRDQLDRYGEIDITVDRILNAIKSRETVLILNADDPFVARFSSLLNPLYFYGIDVKISDSYDEIKESIYCPVCGSKLSYEFFNYSQLGKYYCKCGFKNPKYSFFISSAKFTDKWYLEIEENGLKNSLVFNYPGFYNLYNVISAYSLGRILGVSPSELFSFISEFQFQLGRVEKIKYEGFERVIILVKNPAGYNQVLDTIKQDRQNKVLLLILNDNIADGRDVSWIWDVDFDKINHMENVEKIIVSGQRAEDLLVRLKYADVSMEKIILENNLRKAIGLALSYSFKTYILPTYTALFKSRKIVLRKVRNGT